ncbi:hypothetical protein K443DRAFT_684482 [Laccaria amethystina LaAM-08-1]|uniref:CFEM domain-containing protein n=1 Tax=Laccaria amethystina LaAM-08-1 TaxID=1095629 RepID=A0A0C9WIU1_9AGAR|nr:hypothetical protein K443DRAFT_684482 [Laccaria amethystina LaAM-08-1]
MQLSLFLFNLLLVLPLVHGQGTSSLPQCGMTCVNATATSFGCSVNDVRCLCSKSNFVSSSVTCAQGTCPPEDLSTTIGVLGELCAAVSTNTASSARTSPLTTSPNSTSGPTLTSTPPQPSASTSITGLSAPSTVTVTTSPNTQTGTTLSISPNFLPTSVSASGSSTTVVVATIYRPPPSSGARKRELCWRLIMGAVGVVMGARSL